MLILRLSDIGGFEGMRANKDILFKPIITNYATCDG